MVQVNHPPGTPPLDHQMVVAAPDPNLAVPAALPGVVVPATPATAATLGTPATSIIPAGAVIDPFQQMGFVPPAITSPAPPGHQPRWH